VRVHASGFNWEWTVPPSGWVGLVFPGAASFWSVYGFHHLHLPVETANGLAPAVVLVAMLARRRKTLWRSAAPELVLLAVTIALCMLPSVSMLRWSFRWLALAHLLFGITAALGLSAWMQEGEPQNLGWWALGLTACGTFLAQYRPVTNDLFGLECLLLAVAWVLVERSARLKRPAQHVDHWEFA